ncbi:MAG: DUF1569 domain-containing protein [Bryobacterales bacterium]|nr:DUF1569 domain-containing protein [Bryobacterales bacterium]
MPTIFEAAPRAKLLERFARLRPDTKPQWGKMSAGQMMGHCTAGLAMMLGERTVAPRGGPLRLPPLRYLIIHVLPWPHGAPTAPELIMPPYAGDWTADQAALQRAVEAAGARGPAGPWAEHPAFGALSSHSAGVLMWRHLDHHLRQFGLS